MPMPDHRRLHSTSQLANGRVQAKRTLPIAGDVAEAARKRARMRHNVETFVATVRISRLRSYDSQRRLAALNAAVPRPFHDASNAALWLESSL